MIEYKDYPFRSALAPYIKDYIAEKRTLGFTYNDKSYQLYRLDTYWMNHGYNDPHMTFERLDDWLSAYPGESKGSHSSRITAVKGLTTYLCAHEISCDIPFLSIGKDHPVIHVLDHTELLEFFEAVDSYVPQSIMESDYRMADEFPIIFRLLYCCGMRNNEACSLRVEDVDFKEGIITILNGKNHKDRLVYLPEDLNILLKQYYFHLKDRLGHDPLWLFPGRKPNEHIHKGTVDRKFKIFWHMTKASRYCDKDPTPHSLRHGFVVDRLNKWILEGVDVNYMFVYLSKYLGHRDPDESFYYYHLASDAFRILHQKDTITDDIIPEVRRI